MITTAEDTHEKNHKHIGNENYNDLLLILTTAEAPIYQYTFRAKD